MGVGLRRAAYRSGMARTRRLPKPVISVGNLTVGGTGKTPLVAAVAKILLAHGIKPGILTRGYGRENAKKLIVIGQGTATSLDPKGIGDEPAVLARMLPDVPIVLCADRYVAGQVAESRFHVDAYLLDDGFQHLALAHDLDIVALDATQELSNWNLLPAGRQREPLSALRRTQIAVITRADSGDSKSIEQLVARIAPAAKIFHSQTIVQDWRDTSTGESTPVVKVQPMKAAAFCGIGNPAAFFGDLRRWGFNLVAEDAFPDHHIYTVREIEQLTERARGKGASALVTTQKDAVKISRGWRLELPIHYCEIEARISEAGEFEKSILAVFEKAD
jgi:tetraacyldisaccharide 4'-kinase